jgi:diguanylate cyclase (GGDEF)-like protein/PAS domain S-box-containing protein
MYAIETTGLLSDVRALHGIIDAVPHPIFVKDREFRFLIVNKALCRMMGHAFEEIVGHDDYAFFPADQVAVFREVDRRVFETGETIENEEHFTDGEGTLRKILTGKSRIVLSDGTPLLIGCITDITEFRRAEAMIRQLAEHDYLTGLPNRRAFSSNMSAVAGGTSQASTTHSLLLVDLDGFKPVAHGHEVGDLVLCEIARRLKDNVRSTDLVARLGGDEFAIISEVREASRSEIEPFVLRLLEAVSQPIKIPGGIVRVSASIGLAFCPADASDPDSVLRAADTAMYRAKQEGCGVYWFYDPSMEKVSARRVS